MAQSSTSRARQPLAEANNRTNASLAVPSEQQSLKPLLDSSSTLIDMNASHDASTRASTNSHPPVRVTHIATSPPTASTPPPEETAEAKRLSQPSYESTSSGVSKRKYKTHIGPWQLGKTLGKGSSACVRLCRHTTTQQLAAVKIVNRRMPYLVQNSSLAALSNWDSSIPEQKQGEMRVPMAIEREVAILKLIEHPHIMKIYDIWENRSEIYLILEYIDQGDLFTFINDRGKLLEDETLYFFRQMLSAISYCHSFNICHRDLKPENILITTDYRIKIADFGMAALHQTDTHRLATACGSPNYAAPELLKNRQYRGDRADIWSLGVILYVMLAATLPFDDPDLRLMMERTKKGEYKMPKHFSLEARDLIRRMLEVNPDRRIPLKEIWNHPLVQKYQYMDTYSVNHGQPLDIRKGFQHQPVPQDEIDPQLLRQLQSMWHMFSEHDLSLKLTCNVPNDQKAFYWLLHRYREKQLEDFKPGISPSVSDYHHLKPGTWKKRVSTCEFSQPRADGHGRSISRFTVISTTADTEADTIQSYNPYRGSRVLQPLSSQASHAKITAHRDGRTEQSSYVHQHARKRSNSSTQCNRPPSARGMVTSRPQSSRGSLTSLQSSRRNATHTRKPSLRHKRGVDFNYARRHPQSAAKENRSASQPAAVVAGSETSGVRKPANRSMSPELPVRADGTYPMAKGGPTLKIKTKVEGSEAVFTEEELRHFSSNIAKDCDDAFRSSLIEEDSRPLPTLPSDRALLSQAPASPGNNGVSAMALPGMENAERVTEGVAQLAVPIRARQHGDRRLVSAPVQTQNSRRLEAMPCISEDSAVNAVTYEKGRIVSAPPHTPHSRFNGQARGFDYLSRVENSIRVVHSPTGGSPVKIPAPLNVQKKKAVRDGGSRHASQAYSASHGSQSGEYQETLDGINMMKKKKSWFKRSSKTESDGVVSGPQDFRDSSLLGAETGDPSGDGHGEGPACKKRSFSFPFWKTSKSSELKMSIAEDESMVGRGALRGEASQEAEQKRHSNASSHRNIEVKQNWLARLFRVKPATSYLCMTISRRRARQEVAILLREWRKYGIRGIQVDEQRNIVFARVGAKNYLNLKEVSFAAEMITVIEHGKRQPLSIVRFTQERGAASSFHQVVSTMKVIFDSRNLLVADRNKQKMMIKTLNS